MDSRNLTIGVLFTTAVILLAALLIISTRPEPAWASGMTAAGGDYVLTVGRDASDDEELLYVVDSVAERLVVYRLNPRWKQLEVVQGIRLQDLRKAAGPTRKPTGKKRGRGRHRP